jgi:signal transduction histidine kinase
MEKKHCSNDHCICSGTSCRSPTTSPTHRPRRENAAASHELRTPLSVMQTQLQVLLQTVQENNSLTEAYTSQLEEVQKLSKMVNDFLLMSQLQSGRMEAKQMTVDLVALLTQLVERKTMKAVQRQNDFRITFLPEETDFEIIADEEKVEIILINLLDNAVKYAEANSSIQLQIQKDASQVSIQISNAIRADIRPDPVNIKHAFYHSKPLHGEGFGLGLWIANQLAILQNMDLYCSMSSNGIFKATLVARCLRNTAQLQVHRRAVLPETIEYLMKFLSCC